MEQKNKTPRFRLEDITFLPAGISNVIKEIIAEIYQNNKLKSALAGANNLNYSCDPYCSCNTECECDKQCNYCRCVENCGCVDHNPCPKYVPECDEHRSCPDYRFNV